MNLSVMRQANKRAKMVKDQKQHDRFKEAARELGTGDDEERFNNRLRKLARQKLTDESKSESMSPDGDES